MNEIQAHSEDCPPAPLLPIWRFSLAELLGLITVAAFSFAWGRFHVGLGIFVSLFVFPAYLRTLISMRKCRSQGFTLSLFLWGVEFFESCLFLFSAFCAYCLLLGLALGIYALCIDHFLMLRTFPLWVLLTGAGLIAIASLSVFYLILRVLWPVAPPLTQRKAA